MSRGGDHVGFLVIFFVCNLRYKPPQVLAREKEEKEAAQFSGPVLRSFDDHVIPGLSRETARKLQVSQQAPQQQKKKKKKKKAAQCEEEEEEEKPLEPQPKTPESISKIFILLKISRSPCFSTTCVILIK